MTDASISCFPDPCHLQWSYRVTIDGAAGVSIASLAADGNSCSVNFAVVSRHATAMSLCMVRVAADGSSGGYLEIALDLLVNRTGDVWHARVEGLMDIGSLCYGWRADADISWDAGNRFHPGARRGPLPPVTLWQLMVACPWTLLLTNKTQGVTREMKWKTTPMPTPAHGSGMP